MPNITKEDVETLIDRSSLGNVLYALAAVAEDKAEHIETNWQDTQTARPWRQMAKQIERLARLARV